MTNKELEDFQQRIDSLDGTILFDRVTCTALHLKIAFFEKRLREANFVHYLHTGMFLDF